MKEYFNVNPFKDRSVGFWLGLAAAAVAIISSVLYIAVDFGDKSFSIQAFIIMLLGGLSFALVMFTNFKTATLVPSILYVVGFAYALDYTLPPLSDVWNGVNFIGGNAAAGLSFTIAFLVCAILSIVSTFMEQRVNKN